MAEAHDSQETAAGKADEASREEASRERQHQRPERQERARGNQPAQQTFTAADLIRRGSDFLGRPTYVVAGALHGVEPDDELTLDDARGRVEAWLEQPVTKEA